MNTSPGEASTNALFSLPPETILLQKHVYRVLLLMFPIIKLFTCYYLLQIIEENRYMFYY